MTDQKPDLRTNNGGKKGKTVFKDGITRKGHKYTPQEAECIDSFKNILTDYPSVNDVMRLSVRLLGKIATQKDLTALEKIGIGYI